MTVFEDGALDKALKIIRLILPRDASLLALAEVALNRRRPSGVLGVTSESFFLTEHDKLRKQGEIEINRPLSDIRYVRFHQPDDGDSEGGPVLEIITRDENFRVTFRPWAGEGENLEGARRLGDMLATAMNLPEEERRADPLILEAGSRAPRPAVERPRDWAVRTAIAVAARPAAPLPGPKAAPIVQICCKGPDRAGAPRDKR